MTKDQTHPLGAASAELGPHARNAREGPVALVVLHLPTLENAHQPTLNVRVRVVILRRLSQPVKQLRAADERLGKRSRVLRERLEKRQGADLTVNRTILELLADGARGFIRASGALDIAEGSRRQIRDIGGGPMGEMVGAQTKVKRESGGTSERKRVQRVVGSQSGKGERASVVDRQALSGSWANRLRPARAAMAKVMDAHGLDKLSDTVQLVQRIIVTREDVDPVGDG